MVRADSGASTYHHSLGPHSSKGCLIIPSQDQASESQSRLRLIGKEVEELLRERRLSIQSLSFVSGLKYTKVSALIAATIDAATLSLEDFEKIIGTLHSLKPVDSRIALRMWSYLTTGFHNTLAEIN